MDIEFNGLIVVLPFSPTVDHYICQNTHNVVITSFKFLWKIFCCSMCMHHNLPSTKPQSKMHYRTNDNRTNNYRKNNDRTINNRTTPQGKMQNRKILASWRRESGMRIYVTGCCVNQQNTLQPLCRFIRQGNGENQICQTPPSLPNSI